MSRVVAIRRGHETHLEIGMARTATVTTGDPRTRESGELRTAEHDSEETEAAHAAQCSAEPLFGTTDKYELARTPFRPDELD